MAVIFLWVGLVLMFGVPLRVRWLEPVFKQPVLILESDDWGAGPLAQAPALRTIVEVLNSVKNRAGEHPVMTIGVVLEVANSMALRQPIPYQAIALSDHSQQPILDALLAGFKAEVFTLQLHGQCHYWPATLMALRDTDERVRAWFAQDGIGWTEALPDAVQSRWTDARTLPSTPHSREVVAAAVQSEIQTWRNLFNRNPVVAVPTTFVWTADVERCWKDAGIRVVVTPGRRYVARNSSGKPGPADKVMCNGERGEGGLRYVVRDVYFEPALGHPPRQLVTGVLARFLLGRPALVEIHRFNFCGPLRDPEALEKLSAALRHVLDEVPHIRFMSTETLAHIFDSNDPEWIEHSYRRRIAVWLRRIREIPRFWKAAKLSGLALPLWVVEKALA